jgi:hypothetical protein
MTTLLQTNEYKIIKELKFDYKNQISFFLKVLKNIEKNYIFFYKKNIKKIKSKKERFLLFYLIYSFYKVFKFYYFILNLKKIKVIMELKNCNKIFVTYFFNNIKNKIKGDSVINFLKRNKYNKS